MNDTNENVDIENLEVEVEQDAPQATDDPPQAADDPEVFPREYVVKLRQEAAEARVKAKRAQDLERELFAAKVAATGRLADPGDLAFDPALLDDPDALHAAIDELLAARPHYAARTPRGDVGQGAGAPVIDVDLAAMLRRTA